MSSPPRRILIACDKFKGSLSADEANAAIARGIVKRFPDARIERRVIADGGEGFVSAAAAALAGEWIETTAHDALGREISASYLIANHHGERLAVIEMAEASGMWRIAREDRDILRSGTFGTGELMRHAIEEQHADLLIVGLGGSATNDGGAGMAAALGIRFLDAEGNEIRPLPSDLSERLAVVDESAALRMPPVVAACDVTNPLLGPDGATRVFGPQKGGNGTTIPVLESALARLVEASAGWKEAEKPGAGAAGGLGFGLMRFCEAELRSGFDMIAELTGLEMIVERADLIITGEGSLDAQSLSGKGPFSLARMARRHGKRVIAFCGMADEAARASGCFDGIHELRSTGLPLDELMHRAAELLESLAADGDLPP